MATQASPQPAPSSPTPEPSGGLTVEAGADALEAFLDAEPPEEGKATKPETPEAEEPALEDDDEADKPDDAEDDEEPEEDAEPEEEAEKSALYTVPVDGKLERVTLADLKGSYSSRKHNHLRTEALNAERKAFEAEVQETRSVREDYAAALDRLAAKLDADVGEEPDWVKARQELAPDQFAALHADWEIANRRKTAVQAEQHRLASEKKAEAEQEYTRYLGEQQEKLASLVPEWSDKAKRDALTAKLYEYGQTKYGIPREQIKQINLAAAVDMMRKSMLYDELVERRDATVKGTKVVPGQKVMAPGASKQPETRGTKAARERFEKDRGYESAAALIERILK